MIIDAPVTPPAQPRVWEVTKVNRLSANGLLNITLAQCRFDQFKDFPEYDENGNVIAWWADLKKDAPQTNPLDQNHTTMYSLITYSGIKPEIKINGSYKKFTVSFYDKDNNEINHRDGMWIINICQQEDFSDAIDATDLLAIKEFGDSSDINENQIKVKFLGDEKYLNHMLVVKYVSDDGIESDQLNIKIVSL